MLILRFFEGGGNIHIICHPARRLSEGNLASVSKIRIARQIVWKGVMARRLCLLPKSLSNQLMLLRNTNDEKKKKTGSPAFIGWHLCLAASHTRSDQRSGHFGLRFVHLHPIEVKKNNNNKLKKGKRDGKINISFEMPMPPSPHASISIRSRLSGQDTCCTPGEGLGGGLETSHPIFRQQRFPGRCLKRVSPRRIV